MGELLGLKWTDVDWDAGALRIQRTLQRTLDGYELAEPKTQSSRRSISQALQEHSKCN